MKKKDFPVNVFPDVERDAFKKFSKKNVTEDYIKENLRRKGWDCYSPFTDTGLDILATKEMNGKTIYRYIQVKTRALNENNQFGYTLKSKDFETDCRKFFFLYCDTVDDVIIISMYDYLKLCQDHEKIGSTHFGNAAFRNNNNKLNSLTCKIVDDGPNIWTWGEASSKDKTINFNKYLNENGLSIMESSKWDDETDKLNLEISNIKIKLFYTLKNTPKTKELFEDNTANIIIDYLNKRSTMKSEDYIIEINKIKDDFSKKYPTLYESHKRYLIEDMFKGDIYHE